MCGVVLDRADRDYCDGCLREYRAESAAAFAHTGPAALAAMRASGRDPAHGGEAGLMRGTRNAAHVRENAAWEATTDGRPDPEEFRERLLPAIQRVPLSAIMEATGLSLRYCSVIRRGLQTPHPRHWDALARLGQDRGA